MYQFGSGNVFIAPVGGNEATNPTPSQLLTLQDLSLDISQELVEQRGQYKFPDDVAPGDMKVMGKVSTGRWDIGMLNQVFFGDTQASGVKLVANDEPHTIPTTSTYTIDVNYAAEFSTDLGVQYVGAPPAGNTQALVRVTGVPITGQYAVSAGVYTFATADHGLAVAISYEWQPTSTTEVTKTVLRNIPAPSGPYTITISPWSADVQVRYTGVPPGSESQILTPGSVAAGCYTAIAGVYTFASADASQQVEIIYQTLQADNGGQTVQVNNQLMGYGPVSEVYFQFTYQGSPATATPANAYSIIHLTSVRFSKANMPIKRKGYVNTELDFEAYANVSGLVAEFTNPGCA